MVKRGIDEDKLSSNEIDSLRFLDNLWLRSAGMGELELRQPDLDKMKVSEWSKEFEDIITVECRLTYRDKDFTYFFSLCKNRLIQGSFRYGSLGSSKPKWNREQRVEAEVKKWNAYHCTESIVDIFNMCLLEWVEGDIKADWPIPTAVSSLLTFIACGNKLTYSTVETHNTY